MKNKLKDLQEKLLSEKKILLEELGDLGKVNPENNDWEATPEEQTIGPEADENDLADRFEDYAERTAALNQLERRLSDVNSALEKMEKGEYGRCEVCDKAIEKERLEANPAARTCLKHMK
jgi:RNA polymerase-binding transcription factor DksA